MPVAEESLTKITTKQEALEAYRELTEDYEKKFLHLAEALGYTRGQSYNWDEVLPEKIRNQVIGFLVRKNCKG